MLSPRSGAAVSLFKHLAFVVAQRSVSCHRLVVQQQQSLLKAEILASFYYRRLLVAFLTGGCYGVPLFSQSLCGISRRRCGWCAFRIAGVQYILRFVCSCSTAKATSSHAHSPTAPKPPSLPFLCDHNVDGTGCVVLLCTVGWS